jgi:Zn-dependent M16 (insulinase) family peptidase
VDKPASPAGEVKKAFYDGLYGRTLEHKRELRESIISTTVDDLKRVTETYLSGKASCSVILTDAKTAVSKPLTELGWTYRDIV